MSPALLLSRARTNHASVAPVPWTPANLTVAPTFWVNDASTVVDAGSGACSSWSDISGSGLTMTQSTSSARPLIVAAGLNGRRTIRFDGTNDLLSNNSTNALNLYRSKSSAWALVVYKKTAADASGTTRVAFSGPSGNADGRPRMAIYAGGSANANTPAIGSARLDSDTLKVGYTTDGAKSAVWTIALATFDWSANVAKLYLNGESSPSASMSISGSGGRTSDTAATNALFIAANINVAFGNIEVAEIVSGTEYPPTSDDRDKLAGYAANRWALTSVLPTGHPYKSSGPTTGSATLTTGPTASISDASARISFRADRACGISVKYSTSSDLSGATTTSPVFVGAAADFTGKIDIAGLAADTTYYYTVLVNGVDQFSGTYPRVKTLPTSGVSTSFSFVFGSCTRHSAGADSVFDAVPSDARFLLHLGDTIYADDDLPVATTLPAYRTKRRNALAGINSASSSFKSLRAKLPVFMMWDDHDLVDNFSGGTGDALYAPAKQAFQEYHAKANPDASTGGELYYTFQVGDVGFFVADLRSHRSPNTNTDDSSKTILGATQKAALKAWLLANNASLKFKFICASVPAHGYAAFTAGDSWGGIDDSTQAPNGANGFRTERNEMWDFIDANSIGGVVFISGDQHWAGSFKTTYASRGRYEFMASPFNRSMLPVVSRTADPVNGPVFWKYGTDNNMGVVSVDTTASPPTVAFQLYNASGSLGSSYLTSLTADQIDDGL